MYPYNKRNVPNSRVLRKSMTAEERQIWYHLLKRMPFSIRRQHCIGKFIVDFYIAEKKTVIEIDGIQHHRRQDLQNDKERDEELSKLGIKVLRISNNDINYNFGAVVTYILHSLNVKSDELNKV